MIIKKKDQYYFILFLLFVVDLNFLNLIDTATFNIGGIYYTDIVFLLNISVFLYQIIKDRFQIVKKINITYVLCVIVLMVLSACAGHITYNQSIVAGIVAQREWVSWMLLIYPLSRWIQLQKLSVEGIKKCIINLCNIYALISIIQYLLYDVVKFTYTMVNNRYGSVRLYFNTIFFCFAIGIVIDDLISGPKHSLKNSAIQWIELLAYLFVIVFITKGRMQTISLLCAIIVCSLIRRDMRIDKKIILCLLMVVLTYVFMNSTMGQDILDAIMGTSENDTLSVRDSGRVYYLGLYTQSWKRILFGCGFANSHNSYAIKILNPLWEEYGSARYYLEDVGILSPLIKYGLVGIVFWIGVVIKNISLSYKIYNKSGEMAYLQFLLIDLIACATLIPTMFNTTILFPLITVLILFRAKELQIIS